MNIPGIHHITAISGSPQPNFDFYTDVLGLRLVKKTVNFDDPQTYHLYYGDETGGPGTLITFFPFQNAMEGKAGTGMANRIAFAVPDNSFRYWTDRIAGRVERFNPPAERFGRPVLTFQDPDGIFLEIMPVSGAETLPGWDNGDIPATHSIHSFAGTTLLLDDASETAKLLQIMGYEPLQSDGIFQRFVSGENDTAPYVDLQVQPVVPGRMGRGTIHHIAFRTKDESEQLAWREEFIKMGLQPTEVIDRQYFKSIYFREPGGVLFELATDSPGMLIDESKERLGAELKLPPQYEDHREWIEARLPELRTE